MWGATPYPRGYTAPEEDRWGWVSPVQSYWYPRTTLCVYVCAKPLQSCLTLCDPMDCSLLGSSVHGILQARIMKWVAISSSRGSSRPRDQTCISYVSCTGRRVLHHKRYLRSPRTTLLPLK